MRSLPNGSISAPTLQQVRRLLLVMSLRGNAYEAYGYRVGNLTWLQAMTNLKEIRIVFTLQDNFKFSNRQMAPVRAIAESVPGAARILFGPQSRPEEDDIEKSKVNADLPGPIQPMNSVTGRKLVYAMAQRHLSTMIEPRGVLSGNLNDHSRCFFETCVDGAGCVNSTMKTLPLKKHGPVSKILHALAPRGEASSSWRFRM